jgi:hypothetical protein
MEELSDLAIEFLLLLVPQSFMDWANSKFATAGMAQQPSRVIIKTKRLR